MVATTVMVLFALMAVGAGQQRHLGDIGDHLLIRGQLYLSQLQRQLSEQISRVFIEDGQLYYANAGGEVFSVDTGTSSTATPPSTTDFSLFMAGKLRVTLMDLAGEPVANYTLRPLRVGGDNQMRSLLVGDVWFVIHRGQLYTINRNRLEVFGNVMLAQRIPTFGGQVVDIATDSAEGNLLLVATNHASGGDIWRLSKNGTTEYQPTCTQPEDDLLSRIKDLMKEVEKSVLAGTLSPDALLSGDSNEIASELNKRNNELQLVVNDLAVRYNQTSEGIRGKYYNTENSFSKGEALQINFCARKIDVDAILDGFPATHRKLNTAVGDIRKATDKWLNGADILDPRFKSENNEDNENI